MYIQYIYIYMYIYIWYSYVYFLFIYAYIFSPWKGIPHILDNVVSEEFSRTLLNPDPIVCKPPKRHISTRRTRSPEEAEEFLKDREGLIQDFGWLGKLDDTHR